MCELEYVMVEGPSLAAFLGDKRHSQIKSCKQIVAQITPKKLRPYSYLIVYILSRLGSVEEARNCSVH